MDMIKNKPFLTDEKVDDFTAEDFVFVHRNEELLDEAYTATSYAKDVWMHFKKNKGAVLGAIIIIAIILLAIIGPMISGYKADAINLDVQSLPPRIQGIYKLGIFSGYEKGVDQYAAHGVSQAFYWFGTDTNGRDLFTRVWEGTRVSLIIALSAVVIDIVIGMSYGLISGYFGGKVDMVMQRFMEILNGIPTLVVVTLLGLVLPPGITSIVFALMITGSFVGLGIQAPDASLGSLISDGYKSLTGHPHIIMSAIIVLALLMLSFNLFADGIRDAFDPNQKQR